MIDIELNCKYVTVEIKKIIADKDGGLHEVIEKKKVPNFVAEILTGKPVSNDISLYASEAEEKPKTNSD